MFKDLASEHPFLLLGVHWGGGGMPLPPSKVWGCSMVCPSLFRADLSCINIMYMYVRRGKSQSYQPEENLEIKFRNKI